MLAQSMAFAHELCNYVTLTLAELQASGFLKRDNWFLVSKLIFRMFALDFHKVRSAVVEGLDVDKNDAVGSRKLLAKRALWGVIKTHAKMAEYTRIGFKNHPHISSVYVRYLIKHAGIERVIKLEAENLALKERLRDLETLVKEVRKKADTAMNRADEAKKLASKK